MPLELVASIRLHSPHTTFRAAETPAARESPVLAAQTVDLSSSALAIASPAASEKPAQQNAESADAAPSPPDSVTPCLRGENDPMSLAWLQDLLQQAMTEVMAGEATPVQKANAVARLGNLYLKTCRVTELQQAQRALTQWVAELEQQNAELARRLAELEQATSEEEPRAAGEAARAPRKATPRAQDPTVRPPLTWTPVQSCGPRGGKKKAGGTGSVAPAAEFGPRAWDERLAALREELDEALRKRAAAAPDPADATSASP